MTTPASAGASLLPLPSATPRHCPADEYAAFINGLDVTRRRRLRHVSDQLRFVRTYPQLTDWFAEPLRMRLGWRNGEAQSRRTSPPPGFDVTRGWINANARTYLVYLALTGRLRLDWGWLLGIGVLKPFLVADQPGLPLRAQTEALRDQLTQLGYAGLEENFHLSWGLIRLVLHRGDPGLGAITADDVDELRHAVRTLERIPTIEQVMDTERLRCFKASRTTAAYRVGLALFHAGITDRAPSRLDPTGPPALSSKPRINAVMERYLAERALLLRPESMSSERGGLRRFGLWLDTERPHIDRLDQLHRADLVGFMESLERLRKIKHPDQPLSPAYRTGIISVVAVFFRHGTLAEWDDMPSRPLITHADMPPSVQKVPRFIPQHQLEPVMDQVRALDCPLQRCALLVARWSGARRSEIRKLHLDCLDTYPDGTPRLRLAAGKALRERVVPLHGEAAEAVESLATIRRTQPDRGIHDPDLGQPVRYLFLRNGRLPHPDYLFAAPLRQVCDTLGILNGAGKPAIHPHRFRHTLGTQLAERGARTQTIMKILGHKSPGMSMTYAHISDPTVLADYQSVLQPGAAIAGPIADTLRAGRLDQNAIDWLRTNFYKTELELGRCLRLPQEGPCECDLYLSCAKFVTTPQYAPRLRERLCVERQLTADAQARGWDREVDRHQAIANRIEALLDELGEAHEAPEPR